MSDYKNWLGGLASAITIVSYLYYFWEIYKGKVKPHAFTWLAWGALSGIAFAAAFVSGSGAGSWFLLFHCLASLSITAIAFYQGHVKYTIFDWLSLTGAFLGIILWWLTDQPLAAVILATASNAIAFLPTMRKGYYFPHEESIAPWVLGIFDYLIAFFAIESFTLTTVLYPATILFLEIIYILEVFIRQKKAPKNR